VADSRMIRNQYDYLRRLDVDELERLLQLAVNPQCDEEDSDYVDALLEVILEKEQEEDTGRLSDVDEKWQEFQRHYNTEEGKGQHMYYTEETDTPDQIQAATSNITTFPKRRLRRTLMVAAIIVLLVSMTLVPVMRHKNVIQLFAQWTEEQFSFGLENPWEIDSLPEEYQDMYFSLKKCGIETIYIPQYIPDGFVLQNYSLYTSPKTGESSFAVMYQKGAEFIIFQLEQNDGKTGVIKEKDSTIVETYNINGIKHYVLSNNNNNTIAWHIDELRYALSSSLPISQLKLIINSMY